MKTLLIMRHAKSAYPAQIASDFDRPLNKRGIKDVPRMARALGTTTLIPDRILSSPARRARQTSEGLATGLGTSKAVLFDERLYLATPPNLAAATAELPDGCATALVVAHNPGLEEWVQQLCSCHLYLPTAGLVALHLDISKWDQIQTARGQLQWFIIPRLVKAIT